MRFGIVVFPGSNCDSDCYHVARELLHCEAEYIWHKERDLKRADVVVLPGGFAYGDYLRAGALARFSPVMDSVAEFAGAGGPVLGIWAKRDRSITPEKVAAFDQALTEAGVEHEFHSYDAEHAFANPSGGRYNPEAAKDAWDKTLKFLDANVRSK